jgi:hypothetical protein
VGPPLSQIGRGRQRHVKALVRAFRWRKRLGAGAYGRIEEVAAAGKTNSSYVSRVLRLTLPAPDIVDAVFDGQHPTQMTLTVLMRPFAVEWDKQRIAVGNHSASQGKS